MRVSIVAGMRNLRIGFSLIGLSLFAIMVLRLVPGTWLLDVNFANSTVSYVVLGLIFFVAVNFLGLSSLEYFRLPRLHVKSVVAILVASVFVFAEITNKDIERKSSSIAIGGVIFLLAIGFGEEMFSRAFTFGVLRKFGNIPAIFFSSLLFGLMHLNLYVGSQWDPWAAYWHIVNTFAFGVFICALLILTRSIWLPVIFHALSNWGVVFDKEVDLPTGRQDWGVGFWEGITVPMVNVSTYIGCAILLLWIERGSVPTWVHRLALKWKLFQPEPSMENIYSPGSTTSADSMPKTSSTTLIR